MRKGNKSVGAAVSRTFEHPDARLHELWGQLHHGDREPWPEAKSIARLGTKSAPFAEWLDAYRGGAAAVAQGLRDAWRAFHAGDFTKAIKLGGALGPVGAVAANKAAAIYAVYGRRSAAQRLELLESAAMRGEAAVKLLPDYSNAHYMLALALGRYSQDISIIKAAATGVAGRVRTHLERSLKLEPLHAEGHVALGLYHAELIGKLGRIAAGLTYGASQDSALEEFRRALKLAPDSPIVHIEYANGLLLLDARRNRAQAEKLYEQAAAHAPIDAMEQFDVERAQRGLA
jgi:tetratricopeptide (TPR) repeat protein